MEDLTHGYGGRLLFKNANLEIERGDRVAIIGPNGCAGRGGAGRCAGRGALPRPRAASPVYLLSQAAA